MITPFFWDQEVLPTRQFNQLNIADVSPLSFNIVEKSSTVNEDINESSPQQATGYLERNCAEALPAFALTSYGAVASPLYRAESVGEGRSSLRQAAEYLGEGE